MADQEIYQWFVGFLQTTSSIGVGTTREQLESLFVMDGGIVAAPEERFRYIDCGFVKVRVVFSVEPVEDPSAQVITQISNYYIEPPYLD